jgi:AcrR family transcriptional regulator
VTSRGRRTRERLVTAARLIFERDGFLDARIADIADAAGVASGSFYTYFDSKETIFREVAIRLHHDMMSPDDGESRSERSPVEAIERANRKYLESYAANAALMGVIDHVSYFNNDLRAIREERARSFTTRAAQAIERLQVAGLADRELNPHYAASALTSMMSRFAYIWFVNPPGSDFQFDFDEAVRQLTRLWANAVGLSAALELQNAPTTAPNGKRRLAKQPGSVTRAEGSPSADRRPKR